MGEWYCKVIPPVFFPCFDLATKLGHGESPGVGFPLLEVGVWRGWCSLFGMMSVGMAMGSWDGMGWAVWLG